MYSDLIIDEEELRLFIKYVMNRGQQLDLMIDSLVRELRRVNSSGIISGNTADQLQDYTGRISVLENCMADYSLKIYQIIENFISEVQAAER